MARHASGQALVCHADGCDAATARRSRSGRISSDRSAASRSPARCGWSASSALASPGLPFDLHPEYPPQGIPRADLDARYGEGYDARTRELFAAEGLAYAPPPDVVSNTRLALELGEGARAEGLHRRLPRPRHGCLLGRGHRSLAAARARGARARRRQSRGGHRAGARRPHLGAGASTRRPRARRRVGATGVPAFVIDWRVLVVGAQPREVLAQAVEQARMSA